jgi:hypothetical protein
MVAPVQQDSAMELVIPERMPRLTRLSPDQLVRYGHVHEDIAALAEDPDGLADVLEALSFDVAYYPAMIRVLALSLGVREGLWWAILAARLEEAVTRTPTSEAMKIAETWLREQDDQLRHVAFARAQAEGMDKPSSLVCMAAYLSGPSGSATCSLHGSAIRGDRSSVGPSGEPRQYRNRIDSLAGNRS